MRNITAIAANTFREGLRAKTLYVLFAYGLLILFAASALTPLAMGEQGRILKDLGLAGIEIMGALLAIVIGTTLVHQEVEKRTIYVILSKPVERYQFIAGKYLGMEALLLVLVLAMTVIFALGIVLLDRAFPAVLLVPIALIFLKLSIINSLALLFSSLASPVLGAVFTVCLYLAGNLSRSILQLAEKLPAMALKMVMTVLYYLLPNLGNLDFKNEAVFGMAVVWPQVWWGVCYAAAYALAVLTLTAVLFEGRDAK